MVVFYVGKVFREMFFTCYKSDQGFNFLIQKNAVRGVLNDDCSMNCYYRDHFIYIINFSGDAYFSLDPFSFFGRFFSVSSVVSISLLFACSPAITAELSPISFSFSFSFTCICTSFIYSRTRFFLNSFYSLNLSCRIIL